MNRKLVFMKARLEKDLYELEEEVSQQHHLIQRKLLSVEIGVHCAFISFQFWISSGPFEGCRLNITLKIKSDYPFAPPQVYCHDRGFFHPNKDVITNQVMFSLVDPKFWKPTFELARVLSGIEMILLNPEAAYSSLRATQIYKTALEEGIFQKALSGGMDIEGEHCLTNTKTSLCINAFKMTSPGDLHFEPLPRSLVKVKTQN